MTKTNLSLIFNFISFKQFFHGYCIQKLRLFPLLIVLLISNIGFSQLQSVVTDSETKEPISYVNIWVENENMGTTSDEDGYFELRARRSKIIVFSAIGYETKRIISDSIKGSIELVPMILELGEIVVRPEQLGRKNTKELIFGKFKKSKIRYWHR